MVTTRHRIVKIVSFYKEFRCAIKLYNHLTEIIEILTDNEKQKWRVTEEKKHAISLI